MRQRLRELNIKVESQNLYYAKLLLQDYAGQTSELTASNQYFNHQGVLFKKYPEVSKVLEEIGEDEVVHLKILSKIIALLGINPKYRIFKDNKVRVWWCPSYIKYSEDILEILKINIQSEKDAIKQYEYHLELIEDKYIKEILNFIVVNEKEHIQKLTEVYKHIKVSEENRPNDSNQLFTIEEIQKNYNGKDGNPSYVVIDNIVFDVTNSDEWQNGSHHGLYVGEEHTKEFYSCHGQKLNMLKEKLPIVGYIKE